MAPREKKTIKSDDDSKKKKAFFKRKFPGFKKKATELSILCGNSVGFICYGPDNDLHVWPEPKDNPQALPQIIANFNALSDHKRKIHACDLYDFPDLKGLSCDELRSHLSNLDSHLLEIKRQKISIVKRKYFMPKPEKETEDDDHHLRVSDNNATISNCKSEERLGFGGVFDDLGYLGSCDALKVSNVVMEDDDRVSDNNAIISNCKSEERLGFGGIFDDLGYLGSCDALKVSNAVMEDDDHHLRVSDNNATISNCKSEEPLGFGGVFDELGYLGSCDALKVSNVVMEADSSRLDPLPLGFPGGDYYNDEGGDWDFDFCLTPPSLLDDAWMISGLDPLPVTENWGSVF